MYEFGKSLISETKVICEISDCKLSCFHKKSHSLIECFLREKECLRNSKFKVKCKI